MQIGTIFWMLIILWLLCILGAFFHWGPYFVAGGSVLEFALFFFLGWQVFGPMIQKSGPR